MYLKFNLFTTSIATTLVQATVISHLQGCHHSLFGLRLHTPSFLHTGVRVIPLKGESCHSSAQNPLLLCNTIKLRVKVKILTMVHKALDPLSLPL